MMAKRKTKSTKPILNRIKEVLEEQGKTQTWLAEKLDKDFVTVTRYVNNHRQPSIETIFEIAKILKVNPRDLINS
ncbi:helix-turn-helix domain-containing protein [Ohtaekwangia kribbensis]|jgi:putative transcriptional regulator|uniref:Helix-turn-helix domain-containing protein n=1 Tax=Ohtaekwangia kribbensis TaxID=688913 RepID=A0ABW3KA04_9BACT